MIDNKDNVMTILKNICSEIIEICKILKAKIEPKKQLRKR